MPNPQYNYNYDENGQQYAGGRQTDPYIASIIHEALGNAQTVLNVGAGTGSYEPADRYVAAVEPSAIMRAQRPAHAVPAIIGKADALPFDNNAFDAAMAILTIHHWPNPVTGLQELRRVSGGPVIIFTYDPGSINQFWLADYVPELIAAEKARFPAIDFITQTLGGNCTIQQVLIPADCRDGFNEAFYARPEAFLNPAVRKSQSAWGVIPEGVEERVVAQLAADIKSGEWDRRYGHLRSEPYYSGAIRMVIANP